MVSDCGDQGLQYLLYLAETEIHQRKDDSKIKTQKNIGRHGLRPLPNVCRHPDPPLFGVSAVEFLGHHITAEGAEPLQQKVAAIIEFQRP